VHFWVIALPSDLLPDASPVAEAMLSLCVWVACLQQFLTLQNHLFQIAYQNGSSNEPN